ncbi:MAG: hypothetical protein LBB53_00055 [Prevotellaceae bacterium]|jgi:hypothetical protein|nr:hypothetical protein [Prevotellaceae bacterium]
MEEEKKEKSRGRQLALEMYKSKYPDTAADPDDDAMFDDLITEGSDWKDKYSKLNTAHEELGQKAQEDPFVAKFLSMILNGEDPYYSMGKVFGDFPSQIDDESLEQLRKGQDERKSHYAKWQENSTAYVKKINDYAAREGLSEEQAVRLNNTLLDLEDAFNMKEIPDEVIDIVWKGLDSEEAQAAAAEAAKLAGKNEVLDEMKNKQIKKTEMPDLNTGAGRVPKNSGRFQRQPEFKTVDDFDLLKDSVKIK